MAKVSERRDGSGRLTHVAYTDKKGTRVYKASESTLGGRSVGKKTSEWKRK